MIEANAHFAICEAFSKAEYMLQSKLHKNFMNIIAEISVNMNFWRRKKNLNFIYLNTYIRRPKNQIII